VVSKTDDLQGSDSAVTDLASVEGLNNGGHILHLNVGGEVFVVTRATLQQVLGCG